MRYILDSDGYIQEYSFEHTIICDGNTCTEYTGTNPEGYDSLEAWAIGEDGKINAWKIQDGNLVFDSNKYSELQTTYETEAEENTTATHQWVRNNLGKQSQLVTDEFSKNKKEPELVILNDSGNYEIPKIEITTETTITDDLTLKVSNKNLLENKALTTTISGVTFTINQDKSITIDGTSTAAIEFILSGSLTNTDMLFSIVKDIDYIKSGLGTGITLNLYNYDGTDRTLVNSGGNGTINLSTSSIITCSSLSIANGTTFDDLLISPQIEINSAATDYVKHEENYVSLDLGDNSFTDDDTILIDYSTIQLIKADGTKISLTDKMLYSYNPTSIVFIDKGNQIDIDYFAYKSLDTKFTEIKVTEDAITQSVTNVSNQTSDTINKVNGLEEVQQTTNTSLSELQLTVNNISNTVQIQGGANIVENSVMLYGTDLYTITDTQATEGTILSGKITDLVGKTLSEAGYILQNKKVVHDTIKGFIVGKQYNMTFKYSNEENNNLKVILDNLEDETILNTTDGATLEEISYSFVAKSTEISFSVESNYADDDLVSLITDLIIKSGNIRNDWEPAKTEIIGTNLVIYYNGVEITSPSQKLKTKIDNLGFVVINTDTNTNILECTKDGIITTQITLNGSLKQGSFTIQTLTINGDSHWMIS